MPGSRPEVLGGPGVHEEEDPNLPLTSGSHLSSFFCAPTSVFGRRRSRCPGSKGRTLRTQTGDGGPRTGRSVGPESYSPGLSRGPVSRHPCGGRHCPPSWSSTRSPLFEGLQKGLRRWDSDPEVPTYPALTLFPKDPSPTRRQPCHRRDCFMASTPSNLCCLNEECRNLSHLQVLVPHPSKP